MMEIMPQEMQTNDLKELVNKLNPDSIGNDIEKGKLMEISAESDSSSKKVTGDETGAKVEQMDMSLQSKNL